MPDCYHVVSSDPQRAADDLAQCVQDHKGNGRPEAIRVDEENRLHSLIHYDDERDARDALKAISKCLKDKDHEVTEAILWHLDERGLRAIGYPDGGDGSATTVA